MKRVLLVLTPFTSSCMPSQCQCVYDNNTHRNNIAAGRRHFVCVSFLQTLHVTIYLMYVCWLSVWLRLALLTASLITSLTAPLTASRVRGAIEVSPTDPQSYVPVVGGVACFFIQLSKRLSSIFDVSQRISLSACDSDVKHPLNCVF